MNLTATILALQGYIDLEHHNGTHPSEPLVIPLTLAEWEAILERLRAVNRNGVSHG